MKTKLSLLLLLSAYVSAADLTGYIGVGTAYISQQDNFLKNSTNDTIDSLDKTADSYNKYYVLPTFDLQYGGYFAQVEMEDEFGVNAGYSWKKDNKIYFVPKGFGITQKFENTFSYTIEQRKKAAYADVYAVNSDRIVKNATISKLELKKEKVFDILDINYKLVKTKLDDVVSADTKQSGIQNEIEFMYLLPNATKQFSHKIGAILGDGNFDGDSNDYYIYGLKYDMKLFYSSQHIYFVKANYKQYNFDTQNSYFNTIRDEKSFGVSMIYTKLNFMGNKKLFLNTIGFISKTDSNIEFFKKSTEGIAFNLGYNF